MTVYDLAARFPGIADLRRCSKAMAMLDAIMTDDYPTFRYDAHWAEDQEMASQDNGSGDEYSIVFTAEGAFVRGFDHESTLTPYANDPVAVWPGVVDTVPEVFHEHVEEPAFSMDDVPGFSLCLWRTHADDRWQTGQVAFPEDDRDGSDWLFEVVETTRPESYQEYAAEYFEVDLPLAAIEHVYALRPLTSELVTQLNPERTLADLQEAINEIGYPAE